MTKTGRLKGQQQFQLPSFGDKVINPKSLPLSYAFSKDSPGLHPDPQVLCDFTNCGNNDTNLSSIIRLACFHTCHKSCFIKNGKVCPICTQPFLKKITELTESFNNSLLKRENQEAVTCSESIGFF